jgi:hypothetical protein
MFLARQEGKGGIGRIRLDGWIVWQGQRKNNRRKKLEKKEQGKCKMLLRKVRACRANDNDNYV